MEYYSIVSALPAILWMAVCLLTAFHGQGSSLRGRRLRVYLEWAGLSPDEIEYRMRVPFTGVDSDLTTTEAATSTMEWLATALGAWPWRDRTPTEEDEPVEPLEDLHLAGLQWIAACEVAAHGHRGSNPTRDAEDQYRWAAGVAAVAIAERWNGLVPLPERIAAAAGRHECFCTEQSVQSPPVATPYGEVTVEVTRPGGDPRWAIRLVGGVEAQGYILPGTMSARRLLVEAAPLYDAEGQFWGVEARVTRTQTHHESGIALYRHGLPCWGAEWRMTASKVTPSDVGAIDLEVECPWPARHGTPSEGTCGVVDGVPTEWVTHRQGDLVFTTVSPGDRDPYTWPDLDRLTWEPESGEVGQAGPPNPPVGEWVRNRPILLWPEGVTEVVISHPDHPSIRLPLGPSRRVWVHQASRSVVPRRLGGAD